MKPDRFKGVETRARLILAGRPLPILRVKPLKPVGQLGNRRARNWGEKTYGLPTEWLEWAKGKAGSSDLGGLTQPEDPLPDTPTGDIS